LRAREGIIAMRTDHEPPVQSVRRVILEAVVIGVLLSAVGLIFNFVRAEGIPLVAEREYEILVPCPEPIKETDPVEPSEALQPQEGTLVIDARFPEDFEEWHVPAARNIEFDYLEPVDVEIVKELIHTGARMVIVYGDGDDPDSGREMSRELAGTGLKNVFYVQGGVSALRKAAGEEVEP
jgi:rhodanese-related sulfurtransferase